jgi:hypothetical protein
VNNWPKSFQKYADKIDEVEDDRQQQNGWWVYLKHGWKSDSDPLGCVHQIHEDTVAECVACLKSVLPCECDDCMGVALR